MKKLMFVAAVVAAMTAVCEVASSNIVGYGSTDTEIDSSTKKYETTPMVGVQFFDISGKKTFSLADFHPEVDCDPYFDDSSDDEEEWIWEDYDYMRPGNEYIREFNTGILTQKKAYTYVSEGYLIMSFADTNPNPLPVIEKYRWAIGWWENDSPTVIKNYIKNNQREKMPDNSAITFNNSLSFVCQFLGTHSLKLVSNGEVMINTFAFESNKNQVPIFGNQLPVDIDLTDIAPSVDCDPYFDDSSDDEEEWIWEGYDYMRPGNEYIRLFNTSILTEKAAYTYVSQPYLIMSFADTNPDPLPAIEKYNWAIGWWKNGSPTVIKNAIKNYKGGEYPEDLVRKGEVTIKAGRGFVSQLLGTHNLKFNFPGATSVPSKQQ